MVTQARPELVAVPPGGELGPWRLPDPHQIQPLLVARKADVLCRDPNTGLAEDSLAGLNRFPAFFQRREVPASALRAHDPESSLRGVESESALGWSRLLQRQGASECRTRRCRPHWGSRPNGRPQRAQHSESPFNGWRRAPIVSMAEKLIPIPKHQPQLILGAEPTLVEQTGPALRANAVIRPQPTATSEPPRRAAVRDRRP